MGHSVNNYSKGFRIIPVIDIQNSKAVSSRMGSQGNFPPLQSKVIPSNNPYMIAKEYMGKYGFEDLYIADMDLIFDTGKENTQIIKKICNLEPLNVMLDFGLSSRMEFKYIDQLGIDKIVIGTETIRNINLIKRAIKFFGAERVIIGLDTLNENLLSRNDRISNMTPLNFTEEMVKLGVKELILLELSYIGTGKGEILPVFLDIRKKFPDLSLIISGGFSKIEHLKYLRELGFNGVLISTAIHDGTLKSEEIRNFLENKL